MVKTFLFLIFPLKNLHKSDKYCTFAATELVCIPSELQASHFIYYEPKTKNYTGADFDT